MIIDMLLILNFIITKYIILTISEIFHPYPLAYGHKTDEYLRHSI